MSGHEYEPCRSRVFCGPHQTVHGTVVVTDEGHPLGVHARLCEQQVEPGAELGGLPGDEGAVVLEISWLLLPRKETIDQQRDDAMAGKFARLIEELAPVGALLEPMGEE